MAGKQRRAATMPERHVMINIPLLEGERVQLKHRALDARCLQTELVREALGFPAKLPARQEVAMK